MNRNFLWVPAMYFFATRLNDKKAILFHTVAEFVLGILILFYFSLNITGSVMNFVSGYLAFISIYEIGYFLNDFYSVRFEKNARNRLAKWRIDKVFITLFLLVRVATFLFISLRLAVLTDVRWIFFYLLLAFSFGLHNLLRSPERKVMTFLSLALFRFYAPVFIFLGPADLYATLPSIILFYVLYRTLTYIDSKGLLNMPQRETLEFKFQYYLTLLPVAGLLVVFTNSLLSVYINLYFLLFWTALLPFKNKITSRKNIQLQHLSSASMLQ